MHITLVYNLLYNVIFLYDSKHNYDETAVLVDRLSRLRHFTYKYLTTLREKKKR